MNIIPFLKTIITSDNANKALDKAKDLSLVVYRRNIVEITKRTLIEPNIIISTSLKGNENTTKISKACLKIFASYFIQAFNILSKIENVNSSEILNSLNKNSGIGKFSDDLGPDSTLDLENEYLNPIGKEVTSSLECLNFSEPYDISLENNKISTSFLSFKVDVELNIKKQNINNGNVENKVELIKIPLFFSASIIYASFIDILNLAKKGDYKKYFRWRLDEWRSGKISLWNLIFANDLIEQDLKESILLSKRNKSLSNFHSSSTLSDVGSSLNDIILNSNDKKAYAKAVDGIFIISSDEFKSLDKLHLGKMKKILDRMYALILASYDQEWDMVDIYINGLKSKKELTISEIKDTSEKNSENLLKLFQTLTTGNKITF